MTNEKGTTDNGASLIMVDNTEASVPSTSNITNIKDRLLQIYDGPEIVNKICNAELAARWKHKLNKCYAIVEGSKLSCLQKFSVLAK